MVSLPNFVMVALILPFVMAARALVVFVFVFSFVFGSVIEEMGGDEGDEGI